MSVKPVDWIVLPLSSTGFNNKSILKKILFDCTQDKANPKSGEINLNRYIKQFAWKNNELGIAKTFVVLSEINDGEIIGYYSSSMSVIDPKGIPNPADKLPGYPIPAMLIGKLAVAQEMQGKGIGKILVKHALKTVVDVSEKVGVYAIRIDPMDEEAKNYYVKIYGFLELQDTLSVYLPVSTIKDAVASADKGA